MACSRAACSNAEVAGLCSPPSVGADCTGGICWSSQDKCSCRVRKDTLGATTDPTSSRSQKLLHCIRRQCDTDTSKQHKLNQGAGRRQSKQTLLLRALLPASPATQPSHSSSHNASCFHLLARHSQSVSQRRESEATPTTAQAVSLAKPQARDHLNNLHPTPTIQAQQTQDRSSTEGPSAHCWAGMCAGYVLDATTLSSLCSANETSLVHQTAGSELTVALTARRVPWFFGTPGGRQQAMPVAWQAGGQAGRAGKHVCVGVVSAVSRRSPCWGWQGRVQHSSCFVCSAICHRGCCCPPDGGAAQGSSHWCCIVCCWSGSTTPSPRQRLGSTRLGEALKGAF